MADVPGEAIDAALAADLEWMHTSRSAVFRSCSRDQVRVMIEAAGPVLEAAQRKRDAALLWDMAAHTVPGVARSALVEAARVIGGEKRSDERGPGNG